MIVIDASALLGFISGEPGCSSVGPRLPEAVMSCVNLSEVLARLARDGHDVAAAAEQIRRTGVQIVPFDEAAARAAATLTRAVRSHGLGIGDRACLALAQLRGRPAVTADRVWAQLDIGITVEVLR